MSKNPKYKEVMQKFSEGRLFTPNGKKVIDPEIAEIMAKNAIGAKGYESIETTKDLLDHFGMNTDTKSSGVDEVNNG